MVIALYTTAIAILVYGVYLISPIYVGKLFHYIFSEKLGNDLSESAEYDEEEEEDSEECYYEDDENDFMSKFVNFIARLGNDADEEEDDQEDEESYEERINRLKKRYLW